MALRIIDVPSERTADRAGWAYLRRTRDARFASELHWVAAQVLDDEIHWARTHNGAVTVHVSGYVNIEWPNVPDGCDRNDLIFEPLHAPAKVTRAQADDLRALLDRGYGTFTTDRNGSQRVHVHICHSIPRPAWQILFDRGWAYEHGGRVVVSFAGRIALALYEARAAGLHGDRREAAIREAADAHRIP
ncbi:hypothetical protein CFC35_05715 [Streptomyces sp. FBKL.4005]|uniref:hypothetical protein n=1 Tax=Streptomyces sp. FBKL.4005 TaxID=2015515 RepID=UPI000B96494A|nr:hypothetical protein [Streptomyces sp. FBKL.4005]OYP14062.1 hypothetical protein CFC35_05715 [Streptomyces sp. FBKL.4005]